MIFKQYQDASSSKRNLSKRQALWAGTYKKRNDELVQIEWSKCSIKKLDC